ATAETPSPRPVKPSSSVVVAETETGAPTISVSVASASSRRGPILERLPTICTAPLPIARPCPAISATTWRSRRSPETSSYSLRPVPTSAPRSPSPAADSRASTRACATTSPSECPSQPSAPSKCRHAIMHGLPGSTRWVSVPTPTRGITGSVMRLLGARGRRVQSEFGEHAVVGGGDLERQCVSLDGDDGLAEPLDQSGVVGRHVPGRVVGGEQEGRVEALRGLHGAQRGPVGRADHHAVVVDLFDGVDHRQHGNHGPGAGADGLDDPAGGPGGGQAA